MQRRFEKLVAVDVERLEDLANAGRSRLVEHGEDEVFDADIFVLKLLRLILRLDQEFIQALGDMNALAGGGVAGDSRDAVEFLFDFRFE